MTPVRYRNDLYHTLIVMALITPTIAQVCRVCHKTPN